MHDSVRKSDIVQLAKFLTWVFHPIFSLDAPAPLTVSLQTRRDKKSGSFDGCLFCFLPSESTITVAAQFAKLRFCFGAHS
jgi:hypothetical protein